MYKNHTQFANSKWIRDKRFSKEKNIKNIHTFFRKNIYIDDIVITDAKLMFTADDYCKIYINGEFAVSGPAPGYIHHYYFMSVDIKKHLKPGKNVIAVHAYYQGLKNRVWNSGDGLAGFKADLDINYKDGHNHRTITDISWLCYDCKAYKSDRTFGYTTQYAEDIDMRLFPVGWTSIDFDDSGWNQPRVMDEYPHKLREQPTAPLSWNKKQPLKITRLAESNYLIDFGREVVGCTALNVSGEGGHVIEIRHAEELNNDGSARYNLRANCDYREFITLSGKNKELVEFFDYKAFRYVELVNYPGKLAVSDIFVTERHYPFDNVSELETSDDILNEIWDICSMGVRLGTQDSFLDCMTREKGAYLGDAFVTGLSHLYLTGRSEMLKKVLIDFAESTHFCPGLRAVSPGAFEQDIVDYSLLFIPLLHEYYMWTGDLDFLKQILPVVNGIMKYFTNYENNDGLLENFTGKPLMVDWPANLRDNYDDNGLMGGSTCQKGINSLLNIYYYGTISTAQKIYRIGGNSKKSFACSKKADMLKWNLKNKFLTDKGFVDTGTSTHVSMHTNALALMFKLVTREEAKTVISVLKGKRIKCGVYFSFFLLKGLFNYGEFEFAYDLMTCDDVNSWQNMLKEGATACMETWGLNLKRNTSLCHPWASAPIYMIAAEIFGLKPKTPGWKDIFFYPKIPAEMKHGRISINIPQGKLEATFRKNDSKTEFHIKAPRNVRVIKRVKQHHQKSAEFVNT